MGQDYSLSRPQPVIPRLTLSEEMAMTDLFDIGTGWDSHEKHGWVVKLCFFKRSCSVNSLGW